MSHDSGQRKSPKKRNKDLWRLTHDQEWSRKALEDRVCLLQGFIPKPWGNLLAKEVYNSLNSPFMFQLIIYLLIGLIYSASSTLTDLINAISSMSLYKFEVNILGQVKTLSDLPCFLWNNSSLCVFSLMSYFQVHLLHVQQIQVTSVVCRASVGPAEAACMIILTRGNYVQDPPQRSGLMCPKRAGLMN